jgi:thiosulfate reductase cytochrome b subunit
MCVASSLTVYWASCFLISLKVATPSNHCYVSCNRRIYLLSISSHATFNQETRTGFPIYKLGKQTALHWICKWLLFAKVLLWGDDKLLSWWKTNGLFVATFKHMPDSLLKLQLLTKWKKMDILKFQLKI